MKMITLSLIAILSYSSFAKEAPKLVFPKDEIISVETNDGDYATISEVEYNIVKINGVSLVKSYLVIDLSSKTPVKEIHLSDGQIIRAERAGAALSGGDAGGGGKN
ncbi:MAG: hypothetical protein COW01_03870 [Bdellovibrionales bacterium CG12_big_fil_rev_8_21_14_0_65_38_15]|nr:MAG: hypothetical protein COW79_02735 [Bdellovibrionales bacterium CG22_combo_CG10-13_8_21_14_all_38_13]PIQ56754.1 MAG: hypothetical protein COW01_03870 [Bdellovibrionales bacterium CG12_big_fil_rev_8_21_14_0_65_38_15]PIR31018.1 MAG: hypothetical protein COV38_02430 [Bdellovibrionales bacterium CG11_big_fil_rev_8_21_14_0_20_38_13]